MFGRAGRLSVKTKRWLFSLGLLTYAHGFFDDSQSRKLQPMWIERKLGVDIDPSAYPECWK